MLTEQVKIEIQSGYTQHGKKRGTGFIILQNFIDAENIPPRAMIRIFSRSDDLDNDSPRGTDLSLTIDEAKAILKELQHRIFGEQ